MSETDRDPIDPRLAGIAIALFAMASAAGIGVGRSWQPDRPATYQCELTVAGQPTRTFQATEENGRCGFDVRPNPTNEPVVSFRWERVKR